MATRIDLTKTFDISELNGSVTICYSYDEVQDTHRPLGGETPEVTDVDATNFCIDSIELEIMGEGFLIVGDFKKKLGKRKYQRVIDALENASV